MESDVIITIIIVIIFINIVINVRRRKFELVYMREEVTQEEDETERREIKMRCDERKVIKDSGQWMDGSVRLIRVTLPGRLALRAP